jgi:prepilin-type N-terminal cleavage/methylation domain-containing protein
MQKESGATVSKTGVSQRSHDIAGFTLIELLATVSIIVIVSSASIPMAVNFTHHYRIAGAAQIVATQIQQARAHAVDLNTRHGVLFNLNYPKDDHCQFTSLDPSPMTGNWDGNVYPQNPMPFVTGQTNYGRVPAPPANVMDPDPANGVLSPHGPVVRLAQEIGFDPGPFNALLFFADGSVTAVNTTGSGGAGAISADGLDWLLTVRDPRTELSSTIRVGQNGRIVTER